MRAIEEAVGKSDVFLAIIGREWETITGEDGIRRIEQPGDFVRLEIGQALGRAVPIIPVLVEGASMPAEDGLPPELKALARINAYTVSHERFRQDVDGLITASEQAAARRLFAAGQGQVDLAGWWQSPDGGIDVYFRQKDARVVGVYRLGGVKMGIYVGELLGPMLEFKWRWYDSAMNGNGRVVLAGNLTKLAGFFWIEHNEAAPSDLMLRLVSHDVPDWVETADFEEYQAYFTE